MDNLTKTLLTGGAMSALAVVPAVAGEMPNFHLAVSSGDHALVLRNGSVHNKTDVRNPRKTVVTETDRVTFTYTGKESTMYKKSVFLGQGTTWYTTTTGQGVNVCKTIPKQKGKVLNKIKYLKIHDHPFQAYVSEGNCIGTLTFYGPDATTAYRFHNTALHFAFIDSVKGAATAHSLENSRTVYNLYAYQEWTVNIE